MIHGWAVLRPFLLLGASIFVGGSNAFRYNSVEFDLENQSKELLAQDGIPQSGFAGSGLNWFNKSWQSLIPPGECDSLGYPFIPYDKPFERDPRLDQAWQKLVNLVEEGESCKNRALAEDLKNALEDYMWKMFGIDIRQSKQKKVKVSIGSGDVSNGFAHVVTANCREQVLEELKLCQEGGPCPTEGACGRDKPITMVLNIFGSNCILFKTLPDPLNIVAVLVHEAFHVYQYTDCWKSLELMKDRGFKEFQASRDEYMRHRETVSFIKHDIPGRSATDPKYGLTWRLFAYKFAVYYKMIDPDILATRPDMTQAYHDIIVDLCMQGVPIDSFVWEAYEPLARSQPKDSCPAT